MKAVGVLTNYYLKTEQANTGLEYITDLKRKIEIRHRIREREDNDFNVNQTIAVNKYLDYKICECLLESNDTKKAWDKLHDLIQTPNFSLQFISDIVLTLSKIASKLNVENKNEELKKIYDDVTKLMPLSCKYIKFNTTLEAVQLLSNVLINNEMKTEALDVYDIFVQSLQKSYEKYIDCYRDRIVARAQIFQFIHMCVHGYNVLDIFEKLLEIFKKDNRDVPCLDDGSKIDSVDTKFITRPVLHNILIKYEKISEYIIFQDLKLII
jgi:tetratricopeptide (TPR) repeat protein